MTIKVTYEVGKVGVRDLMVDKFDLSLRQFFRKYLDGEIDTNHNDIVKIEVA